MAFFTAVGAIVSTIVAFALGWLMQHIAGNIIGGIRGAYRLRKLRTMPDRPPPFSHRTALRFGLSCWYGRRYRNGVGEYWQVDGLIVPMDGRDKVQRTAFVGG